MDKPTIKTYDEMAKEYDEETTDFWKKFPRTVIIEFHKNLGTGKKVLNIGCGPGRDGVMLKDIGLNLICLDASESMLKLARENGLDTVLGDLLSLPFEKHSFDGVWAYTSLLHIKKSDMPTAFSEITRVLKSNGILGLGLIEGEDEQYRESSGVNKPRWFAFYTKKEIEKMLDENGFDILYFEEFKPSSKNYLNYIARKRN